MSTTSSKMSSTTSPKKDENGETKGDQNKKIISDADLLNLSGGIWIAYRAEYMRLEYLTQALGTPSFPLHWNPGFEAIELARSEWMPKVSSETFLMLRKAKRLLDVPWEQMPGEDYKILTDFLHRYSHIPELNALCAQRVGSQLHSVLCHLCVDKVKEQNFDNPEEWGKHAHLAWGTRILLDEEPDGQRLVESDYHVWFDPNSGYSKSI